MYLPFGVYKYLPTPCAIPLGNHLSCATLIIRCGNEDFCCIHSGIALLQSTSIFCMSDLL